MKPTRGIQYKAIFLLITFSLNTVIGFACSIGVHMGFNSGHYNHGEGKHEHKQGGHNHRHDKGTHNHKHSHNYSNTKSNSISMSLPEDENCCKNFTVSFNNLDKQLVQQSAAPEKQKCNDAFFSFNSVAIFTQSVYKEPQKIPLKFLPFHSPPNIRVFIRSFQI